MSPHKNNKSKNQFGLFLFFVIGLFMLQIGFAFTIHGDIGPQSNIIPCIDKPASPFLVGRIDSLVSNAKMTVATKVAPEGAFAPASRKILETEAAMAKIDTEEFTDNSGVKVRQISEERFFEYTVRHGDTLEKISRKLYGNGKMTQSLIRLNRITDDKSLQLGSSLLVPKTGILNSIEVL